jgi:plasmid stabilization system protein ParE
VERIKARCLTLTTFPNRGTPHPELLEGLRTIPHGKAVIAYRVEADAIVVVRIGYAGEQLRPENLMG